MANDGAAFGWETDLETFKKENPFRIDPVQYASDETLESICYKTMKVGNALGAYGEVAEYYRQKLATADKAYKQAFASTLLLSKDAGNAQQQKAKADRSIIVSEKETDRDKAEALYKMACVAQTALEIQFVALRKIGSLRETAFKAHPE